MSISSNYWKFRWINKWDDVWDDVFLDEWKDIMNKSIDAHVFFEPAMVKAWYETYIKISDIEPRFLVASLGDGPRGLLPLIKLNSSYKDAWLKILMPVGFLEFDYHDPIFCGSISDNMKNLFWGQLVEEFQDFLSTDCDLIKINGIRDIPSIKNIFLKSDEAPFLILDKYINVESLISNLDKRSRENVRRKRRKLDKNGALSLKVFSKEDSNLALKSLNEFKKHHSAKWGMYLPPGFLERLVGYSLSEGFLHMSMLYSGTDVVSWHIGFQHKKRFYWYLPAYSSNFAQYSPGQTHLILCIEDAIKNGSKIFDFLKGDEQYKSRWAHEKIELFDISQGTKNFLGYGKLFLSTRIKPFVKKYKNRFLNVVVKLVLF